MTDLYLICGSICSTIVDRYSKGCTQCTRPSRCIKRSKKPFNVHNLALIFCKEVVSVVPKNDLAVGK